MFQSSVSSPCSSCCGQCRNPPLLPPPRARYRPYLPRSKSTTASAFSKPVLNHCTLDLRNLIPAGTLVLPLAQYRPAHLCGHAHAADGWHVYAAHGGILPYLANSEDEFITRPLDFLVEHLLIAATFHADGLRLCVRVYVVPVDIANVQRRLDHRKEPPPEQTRQYIRILLGKTLRDQRCWDGGECSPGLQSVFLPHDVDNRTMAAIYSDLPSPRADPEILGTLEQIEEMRSTLHGYQRISVAAMLKKELYPVDTPDPIYIILQGMSGAVCYFQPATMAFLCEAPMVAQNRGGILCEELGTGKTVIVLALILATLDELPTPEESIWEDRPVMTPVAFNHFPSAEMDAARLRATRQAQSHTHAVTDLGSRVPSLVEILLHRIRASPKACRARDFDEALEDRQLAHLLRANMPFYHEYVQLDDEQPRRKIANPGPRTFFLTAATLVVVPGGLVRQWDSEIHKHCSAKLRVLILREGTKIPRAADLASDYDIVLMSTNAFSVGDPPKKSDISKLYSWDMCKCAPYLGSRIPGCKCKEHHTLSPLLQIRWKRLVIDEGHNAAAPNSRLTSFAQLLSVERRWIVTGTPTANLLGLSLGKNSKTQEGDNGDAMQDIITDTTSSNGSMDDDQDPVTHRTWTSGDREDLKRLSYMMINYLGVPRFAAKRDLFSEHVTAPLLHPQGPLSGAIQVLNQVMETVMIRHRIEDVEKDVVLPPLRQSVVLLDMDPYAEKSYNALLARIAINAVDSQRVDQDYMFHPKNNGLLLLAVQNLLQVLFWRVDDDFSNTEQLVKDTDKIIQTAISRNVSDEDLILLQQALGHIHSVAEDKLWRSMQTHEDVPYRVSGIPRRVFNAWSDLACHREPSAKTPNEEFMHWDRLIQIREMIHERPLICEGDMVAWGLDARQKDKEFLQRMEGTQKTKRRKSAPDDGVPRLVVSTAKRAAAPEKQKEIAKELRAAQERQAALAEEEDTGIYQPQAHVSLSTSEGGTRGERASMLSRSPLARMRIGNSVSSKLNFILNEVLKFAPKEKFLVFSESPLSLAHVAEGLDLIEVKYLQFHSRIRRDMREQLVTTFETSDTYRVFLMELKHGARGLNLITASRVIFCEPVWQADVESQAIKRAHRIGQMRTVVVKTLAIRSTVEERMMARREILKSRSGKQPNLTDEKDMRHYMAHPEFIKHKPTQLPPVDIPLIKLQNPEFTGDTASMTFPSEFASILPTPSDLEVPRKKAKNLLDLRMPTSPELVNKLSLVVSHSVLQSTLSLLHSF